MGSPSEASGEAPSPHSGDHADEGEQDHHGLSMGAATGLNVAINAILNAISGYGIAFLHWKEYDIGWISHHAEEHFETAFVVEDLLVQGASTAIIVTLIVAAILHRQWDAGGHLVPGTNERFLLDEDRTRSKHMLLWSLGTALAGAAFAGLVAALAVAGSDTVSGETFAAARTVTGLVVGGAVGGLVTQSWVTNLTAGRLVRPAGDPNTWARIATGSHRHPGKVLASVLVLTVLLGGGLADLHADVDVADRWPRGGEDADAAANLSEDFESTDTQRAVFQFRTDAGGCARDDGRNLPLRTPQQRDCSNITDEVYVRAMEAFADHIRSYTAENETGLPGFEETKPLNNSVRYVRGLPSVYKMANWTLAGGEDQAPEGAYSLPDPTDRVRWNAVDRLADRYMADVQASMTDEGFDQARLSVALPSNASVSARELGDTSLQAREAYLDQAPSERTWSVFADDNRPLHTVERPVANAHASDQAREDLETLAPWLAAFAVLVPLVALREGAGALAVTTGVGVATTWTAGLMGAIEVPVTHLNLAVPGLVLGWGVSRGVRLVAAYRTARADGLDPAQAYTRVGAASGFATFAGTVTVALGLTVLAAHPIEPLAVLAGLAVLALFAVLLATVAVVPALLSLVPGPDPDEDRRGLPGVDGLTDLGRGPRIAALALVAGLVVGGLVGAAELPDEPVGDPVQAWPEEDPIRAEHETGLRVFHGVGDDEPVPDTSAVVVEGDLADPQTLDYLDELSAAVTRQAAGSDRLASTPEDDLPDAVRTWLAVCCGPQSPAQTTLTDQLADLDQHPDTTNRYPQNREQARDTLDRMFEAPFADLASPFANHPIDDATVVPVTTQAGTRDEAGEALDALATAREDADGSRPDDVTTAFAGDTPARVAVADALDEWLVWGAAVAAGLVALTAFAFTRDPRVVLASLAGGAAAGLGVVGVLAAADVGVSTPVAFAVVLAGLLGADEAFHLAWVARRSEGARAALSSALPGLAAGATAFGLGLAALGPVPGTDWEGVAQVFVRDLGLAGSVGAGLAALAALTAVLASVHLGAGEEEDAEPEAASAAA